jgi:hypothetical protein
MNDDFTSEAWRVVYRVSQIVATCDDELMSDALKIKIISPTSLSALTGMCKLMEELMHAAGEGRSFMRHLDRLEQENQQLKEAAKAAE